MAEHQIKRGLDLPISGKPTQTVSEGNPVTQVAILGRDYPLMKPRFEVKVGDTVQRGQLLFDDRKADGVQFTAPAAGTVTAIHRGAKRAFQSLVIDLSDAEKRGEGEQVTFASYTGRTPEQISGDELRALLVESGLWTALRVRPQDRVPPTNIEPAAVFVTAIDTRPLAPSVSAALAGREEDFANGVKALSKLTAGETFVCVGRDGAPTVPSGDRIRTEVFSGPHPAGLPGTHIHTLRPVGRTRSVVHVGYQDVAAIGHLVTTGKLDVTRVVSLAGPGVREPRLLRTRIGASATELTDGNLGSGELRTVSGCVLHGHTAQDAIHGFLGRYDNALAVIEEDSERVFMGWLLPGMGKFSTLRAFASTWLPKKEMPFTTTTHGSHRAMVPIGSFERVMPLDVMPTFLLRSLLVGDVEKAEQLGALELAEEDLSLCSFVSTGKEDYGKALRNVLTDIWREG